jgi:galactonate dehydratase
MTVHARITNIETFLVPPRWLFVRLDTDAGVVGWGEAGCPNRVRAVTGAIEDLAPLLIGESPFAVERHWQRLWQSGFFRGGPILASAIAGLDQALWDVVGKIRDAPVHELLGGPVRDRLRVYAWIGNELNNDEPAQLAAEAVEKMNLGYTAVKCTVPSLDPLASRADIAAVGDQLRAVREAVGPSIDIALDCHGRTTTAVSRLLLEELASMNPLFIEEPFLPEYTDNLTQLAAGTSIRIATGERLHSRWDVKAVLGSGISILQPDVSMAGGISEMLRIAAIAETWDIDVVPHCAIGPLALAASLQVCFAAKCASLQEQDADFYPDYYHRYVSNVDMFDLKGGYFGRPEGPGLGILINEASVRGAVGSEELWEPPRWTLRDGAVAEW